MIFSFANCQSFERHELHNYSHSVNSFLHLFWFLFFSHLHQKICLCFYTVFKIIILILLGSMLSVTLKNVENICVCVCYVLVCVIIIWRSVMSFFLSIDHFSLFNSLYNKFPEMAFRWQYYRLLYCLPKEFCQLKFNKHCISISVYLLHK